MPEVDRIPADSPFEFLQALDEPTYRYHSILALPIEEKRGEVVGVLQLMNARDEADRAMPFGLEAATAVHLFAVEAARLISDSRRSLRSGLW